MTDSEIITELLKLADQMNVAQRFKEADFLERAAARLMVLPTELTRMQHPSMDADTRRVIQHIWGA